MELTEAFLGWEVNQLQNYSIMPRGQKKGTPRCQEHEFLLRPCLEYVPHPHHLSLSFCARHDQRRSRSVAASRSCLQGPTFNRDSSCASPAFILPGDKDYYRSRREELLEEHHVRYSNYTDDKSELNVPKPRSKNSYCNVCKQYYEDYLDHILSINHKRKLAASPFSKHIHDLTLKFRLTDPATNLNTKASPVQTIIDSDSVEIISNPVKRIKTNETVEVLDSTPHPTIPRIRPHERHFLSPPFGVPPFLEPWQSYQSYRQAPIELSFNCNMNFFINPFGYVHPLQQFTPLGMMPIQGINPIPSMPNGGFMNPTEVAEK